MEDRLPYFRAKICQNWFFRNRWIHIGREIFRTRFARPCEVSRGTITNYLTVWGVDVSGPSHGSFFDSKIGWNYLNPKDLCLWSWVCVLFQRLVSIEGIGFGIALGRSGFKWIAWISLEVYVTFLKGQEGPWDGFCFGTLWEGAIIIECKWRIESFK